MAYTGDVKILFSGRETCGWYREIQAGNIKVCESVTYYENWCKDCQYRNTVQHGCEKKPMTTGKGLSWGYDAQQDYHNPADVEEIEQLRAQVARMREALEQEKKYCNEREGPCEFCKIVCKTREALELIRQYAKDGCYCFVKDVADEALSTDTVQDYHNPADVEVLRKAREALELILEKHTDISNHDKYPKTTTICHGVITEIDKAIGGKEDA